MILSFLVSRHDSSIDREYCYEWTLADEARATHCRAGFIKKIILNIAKKYIFKSFKSYKVNGWQVYEGIDACSS